jgi:Tfp pilus assembly protein FimT
MAMALFGVLVALTVPNIRFAEGEPVDNAASQLSSTLKLMRTKAMTNTSAYRLRPDGGADNQFIVDYAATCTALDPNWTVEASFTDEDLKLPKDTRVSAVSTGNWPICYNSRGIATPGITLTLKNTLNEQTRRLRVFAGGAVDVYDN